MPILSWFGCSIYFVILSNIFFSNYCLLRISLNENDANLSSNCKLLESVGHFIPLVSNISLNESDVNVGKEWTAIGHMELWSHRWNKTGIFPSCISISTAVRVYYLLFNETPGKKCTWELHNKIAVMKETAALWPFNSHLIQIRQEEHAGNRRGRMNKHISEIPLKTRTHEATSMSRPGNTSIHQLCADIGWRLQDLTKRNER